MRMKILILFLLVGSINNQLFASRAADDIEGGGTSARGSLSERDASILEGVVAYMQEASLASMEGFLPTTALTVRPDGMMEVVGRATGGGESIDAGPLIDDPFDIVPAEAMANLADQESRRIYTWGRLKDSRMPVERLTADEALREILRPLTPAQLYAASRLPEGWNSLGVCYLNGGAGVERNLELAEVCFKRACDEGLDLALTNYTAVMAQQEKNQEVLDFVDSLDKPKRQLVAVNGITAALRVLSDALTDGAEMESEAVQRPAMAARNYLIEGLLVQPLNAGLVELWYRYPALRIILESEPDTLAAVENLIAKASPAKAMAGFLVLATPAERLGAVKKP